MGDIARCSIGKANELYNEDLLYRLFGVNAELLIDHAWEYEPCTMKMVKAYKPETNSVCTGHDAAIKETARLTDERVELSEEVLAQLNEKINIIRNNIGIEQNVSITYFIPDAKKAGGSYVTSSGTVKKVDEYEHTIIMTDQTVIPIEQISNIKCEEW